MKLLDKIKGFGVIHTKCRDFNTYIQYIDHPIVLKINVRSFKEQKRGEIIGFKAYDGSKFETGDNIDDLEMYFKSIIDHYELKKIKDNTKQSIIIWTDIIEKIEGFFAKYITSRLGKHYIEIMNFIEFRSIKPWDSEVIDLDLDKWYKTINSLYRSIFIPNKYFYLTPNQIVRKELQKKIPKDINMKLKSIFPENYASWKIMRKSLYAGMAVCKYPGLTINQPIIGIDINSAYIFSMLCMKHPMSNRIIVNKDEWKNYLNQNKYISIGTYEITFINEDLTSACYKDIHHMSPSYGKQTRIYVMTSIDLAIFKKINKVKSITCKSLEIYELDYLPEYVRDTLIEYYIKKCKAPKDSEERRVAKIKLNGIPGDASRRCDTLLDYNHIKDTFTLLPQWGITTNAYCKQILYGLASKLDGWLYSNTDSIYCLDTVENREKILNYNNMIESFTLALCQEYNYDFESLRNLGKFEIDEVCTKFKAFAVNEYIYTTVKGKFVIKAAGHDKKNQILDESLYDKREIPLGAFLIPRAVPQNNTYFEYYLRGEFLDLSIHLGQFVEALLDR